ncbi:hypothetical protein ACI2LF_28865 [Kribbella sp. NPDC020789]
MKILHAQLHLLDRQLIDEETGRLIGKVDDAELDLDADPPRVTALISGSVRIPVERITAIDTAVKLDPDGLGLAAHDLWVGKNIIGKIPGARHETD